MSGPPVQNIDGSPLMPRPRVYAAALDGETCPACAELAGREYAAGDPVEPVIPNPRCTHAEGCRCTWL